jgi:hypothetical protein
MNIGFGGNRQMNRQQYYEEVKQKKIGTYVRFFIGNTTRLYYSLLTAETRRRRRDRGDY